MKNFILTSILFLIIANSFAGIKRLGYWGTPITGVDYATPALAVAACAIGDSLYVYGSNGGSAWSIDITKRLVVIGTGYYYAPNTPNNAVNFNANLQVYGAYSQANITLNDGSSNTIIVGIVGRVLCNQAHTASINNIRISNCYYNSTTNIMYKNGITYDGWEISKCYIISTSFGYPPSSTVKVTNFKFYNNIMLNSELVFSNVAGQNGIIENCNFLTYYSQQNVWNGINLLVQNCIFTNSAILNGYNNTVFNNCVFDASSNPNPAVVGAANILNAVQANIYLGIPTQGSNSDDGRWALKPASPAIGAGIAGIDCGAYGGINPYKLSGIPAVPAFYKLTAPSTSASSNPYTITFSVRANN